MLGEIRVLFFAFIKAIYEEEDSLCLSVDSPECLPELDVDC